jgi:hypothetical protein
MTTSCDTAFVCTDRDLVRIYHLLRISTEAKDSDSADGRGCARKRAIASEHGAEGGEAVGGWWANEARLRHGREAAESL